MDDDQRRAEIWARISAIRYELDTLLAELGEAPERPRRRFTLIQGGSALGAAAATRFGLARRRPRTRAVAASTVGLGVTGAMVAAIAVPAPLARQAVAPTPVINVFGTAQATTVAATTVTTTYGPGSLPAVPAYTATPSAAGTSAAAPAPSSTIGSTGSSTGSSTTATPSGSPTGSGSATPSAAPSGTSTPPAGCLVTLGVNGIVNLCLL